MRADKKAWRFVSRWCAIGTRIIMPTIIKDRSEQSHTFARTKHTDFGAVRHGANLRNTVSFEWFQWCRCGRRPYQIPTIATSNIRIFGESKRKSVNSETSLPATATEQNISEVALDKNIHRFRGLISHSHSPQIPEYAKCQICIAYILYGIDSDKYIS